ncbi:MAG: hypothetical protein GY887_00570 [Halieaceae bacterium]|nr:hypothetical protein [Halieaceae bacterium]
MKKDNAGRAHWRRKPVDGEAASVVIAPGTAFPGAGWVHQRDPDRWWPGSADGPGATH